MHAQWMPTGSEEEQKATKVKASAFLDQIQQGMTHDVSTHVHLGELKEIVARLGEDPQDLIACIKTLMDCCEMINDEHREHELHCHIAIAWALPYCPYIPPQGKAPRKTYGQAIQDALQ